MPSMTEPIITISYGDRSKPQTCCRCLRSIPVNAGRITETFEWGETEGEDRRRFHYCPGCAASAGKVVPRVCATGCGLAAAPGDIYCSGCGSASDRSGWAGPFTSEGELFV